MSVVVDTPVWSQFFRRKSPKGPHQEQLRQLILDGDALLIGMIRQEILSGIKEQKQFERLRNALRAFPDIPVLTEDHETAASMLNECRGKGIQGSNTDFLICAVAHRFDVPILTLDKDFHLFAQALPIHLYATPTKRKPGALKGKVMISPDFDAPVQEVEQALYGDSGEESTQ